MNLTLYCYGYRTATRWWEMSSRTIWVHSFLTNEVLKFNCYFRWVEKSKDSCFLLVSACWLAGSRYGVKLNLIEVKEHMFCLKSSSEKTRFLFCTKTLLLPYTWLLLPVRGFWECLHFLNLFYLFYFCFFVFLFLFLSTTIVLKFVKYSRLFPLW